MFEFLDSNTSESEDFTFESWLESIVENAFLPGSASGPLPCDDQGIAYV